MGINTTFATLQELSAPQAVALCDYLHDRLQKHKAANDPRAAVTERLLECGSAEFDNATMQARLMGLAAPSRYVAAPLSEFDPADWLLANWKLLLSAYDA